VKILVPVKQVASLDGDFTLADDGELREGEPTWRLNEWDEFSLEAAVQLSEAADGEVVVVSVGPERVEEALRACLARGADRAIRVWGEGLAGAADPLSLASVLAAVARAEAPALILCGAQSADAAHAATGVALAGLLDLPRVAVVSAIERDGRHLTVQRELEGGAVEVLRIAPPCLLTVQTGINRPRQPTLRAIRQARMKPVAVAGPAELALEPAVVLAGAGSRTVGLRERPRSAGAKLLEGAPADVAARITEIVKESLAR